jgi:hypothetical protein
MYLKNRGIENVYNELGSHAYMTILKQFMMEKVILRSLKVIIQINYLN